MCRVVLPPGWRVVALEGAAGCHTAPVTPVLAAGHPGGSPAQRGHGRSFQHHMRSGNQLPSCCLCGQTEKGCTDGVVRMPIRGDAHSRGTETYDGRPLSGCAPTAQCTFHTPGLRASLGADTRPGDADLRGKHRPGRVSRCASIVGGNRGKRMLYPRRSPDAQACCKHTCTALMHDHVLPGLAVELAGPASRWNAAATASASSAPSGSMGWQRTVNPSAYAYQGSKGWCGILSTGLHPTTGCPGATPLPAVG